MESKASFSGKISRNLLIEELQKNKERQQNTMQWNRRNIQQKRNQKENMGYALLISMITEQIAVHGGAGSITESWTCRQSTYYFGKVGFPQHQ
jgi:hypothetical protein